MQDSAMTNVVSHLRLFHRRPSAEQMQAQSRWDAPSPRPSTPPSSVGASPREAEPTATSAGTI